MDNKTLEQMKEEFLKTNKIKYIGKRKKPKFEPTGLITVYSYDTTEVIL